MHRAVSMSLPACQSIAVGRATLQAPRASLSRSRAASRPSALRALAVSEPAEDWREKQRAALLSDEQIQKALQLQIQRSIEARDSKPGTPLNDARVQIEAKVDASLVMDAVKSSPNVDSVEVLRQLAQRIPLLNDQQLSAALARQLKASSPAASASSAASPAAPAAPPAPAAPAAPSAPAPEEAPAAAAAVEAEPASKLAPCQSFADGTLLFTSGSLANVDYTDVELPH